MYETAHFFQFLANISKQILQKMLVRKYNHKDDCETQMKPIKTTVTAKSQDNLVYILEDSKYTLFEVREVLEDGYLEVVELNIEDKVYSREPSLNFGKVGVFKNHGTTLVKSTISLSQVHGKVIAVRGLLLTVPKNILTET